ncbi:MAG: TonB-dependent receptor domain-containing protein [Steroidobacteraceae bacterium]
MNRTLGLRPAPLVAIGVALALAQAAQAQDTVLGEVTVTARKRAESIQDVPFAVSARSEDALRAAGAQNIEDVSRNVAGLSVQNLGPGQSQVGIRGISAGKIDRDLAGIKEQVGVYLDESVISLSLFTPDLELYDLNRVEVLRGPQGTLFGSGSLAGTVRYITNQPDVTDDYGDVEVGFSTIDGGDSGGNARAMLNMALSDRAALRLIGYYSELPGYIDAHGPGGVVDEDVNGGDRIGGRLALRWELTDNVAITPRLIYQDTNIDGFNREDVWNMLANPFMTTEPAVDIGEREQYRQLQEEFADEFFLADLTAEFDLGGVVLTSVSSFTDRDILVLRDASQLSGSVTYFNIFNANVPGVRLDSALHDATQVEVFTQELRLASDYEGRFQWVVGGFYSDITRDYGQTLPTPGYDALIGVPGPALGGPVDSPFFSRIPYDFKQTAFFAEGTFDITERLSATVGARYYDYDEDRVLYFGGAFADTDGGPEELTNGPGSTSEDGVLPRVLLSYEVSDNVQFNAQAAEGFRLGGINDPLNIPLCSADDVLTFGGRPTFDSETLWNYELGAKIGFADGRAQFNVAAFHADISDLQVPALAGNCSSRIAINVPESHSTGIEMELSAQPTDRFDFGISATYTQAEIDSTVSSVTGDVLAGIEEGNRLPSTPEFQLAANATYSWPMTESIEGFITGSYQHVGSRYTQMGDQVPGFGTFSILTSPNPPDTGFGDPEINGVPLTTFTFDPLLPAYDIGNIRFGLRGDDWEAALFVNNVGDETARLALDQERGRVARVGYLVNQPRTIGLMFRKEFGGAEAEPVRAAPPPPPPPPPAPPPPPPPPPPPGDADKDGVTDDKDRCPDTTAGVAVDEIGCFREVTLRGVLFDTNSAELTAETRSQIDSAIAQYKTLPPDVAGQTRVTIEGHTDDTGADAYNKTLSEQRANVVKDYVVSKGIDASTITTSGAGESSPTDDNTTPEGRRNNRRVVIRATR